MSFAAGQQEHDRAGPRLSHRLQARVPRQAGEIAPSRRDLPDDGRGHEIGRRGQDAQVAAPHKTEVVAIGNGTAGRETEEFVRALELQGRHRRHGGTKAERVGLPASGRGARGVPSTEDITVRGAVSIGRRLMDPLAELVKIDAKSIGVGQYQHDVDQARTEERPRRHRGQLREQRGRGTQQRQQGTALLCFRPRLGDREEYSGLPQRERRVRVARGAQEGASPRPQGFRAERRIFTSARRPQPARRQRRPSGTLSSRRENGRGLGLHREGSHVRREPAL